MSEILGQYIRQFKSIKSTSYHRRAKCGVVLFGLMFNMIFGHVQAAPKSKTKEDPKDEVVAQTDIQFNHAFLIGKAKKLDLSRFSKPDQLLAGRYTLDIYVNGQWKGNRSVLFEEMEEEEGISACFDWMALHEFGVDMSKMEQPKKDTCQPINKWLPDSSYKLNKSQLRLNISVPQASIKRNNRDYIDPKFWDYGINAAILSYQFNFYQQKRSPGDNQAINGFDEYNTYLSLDSGLNIGQWQYRYDSLLRWRSDQDLKALNTVNYFQRSLPSLNAQITLGETWTQGDFFGTTKLVGVRLASDDRMLPDSARGYAPSIQGVAQTNALVEIYQQGRLIYQTTVTPGSFIIDDLQPSGYGSDLEVKIREANGVEQSYRVAHGFSHYQLRPGVYRYAINFGRMKSDLLDTHDPLIEASYQRGINNALSAYTATQISDNYQSYLLGAATVFPIGAVSLDVNYTNSHFNNSTVTGNRIQLRYNTNLSKTQTYFSGQASYFTTDGYLSLNESVFFEQLDEAEALSTLSIKKKSDFQFVISQPLSERWGAINMSAIYRRYWHSHQAMHSYLLSYNNTFLGVNWGLNVQHIRELNLEKDTTFGLQFSLPFEFGSGRGFINNALTYTDQGYEHNRVGISSGGGASSPINVNATYSHDNYGSSSSIAGNYQVPYSSLKGSYSYAKDSQQAGVGATGTVLWHSNGIAFSNQKAQTMVLVEAPGAQGAEVSQVSGLTINSSGYALVPYVKPFRATGITLDPGKMNDNVELNNNSQQVIPVAGAVAKVRFDTIKGQPIVVEVRTAEGRALPFGAHVYDERQQPITFVGQGSRIYIRSESRYRRLTIKWGEQNDSCMIHLNLNHLPEKVSGYHKIGSFCR